MQEIVKTRITPKKLIESIISRDRLISLINNNLSKNIILIISPAGYGKTTLVLDFFRQSGKKYSWLYLAPDINSFGIFMQYMLYSLRELNKDFGAKTFELLSSMLESGVIAEDETNSINAIIGTFTNEFLNSFTDDVFLVIDDLHNASGKTWLTSAFNSLIEDFPPNLHIFITSRTLPEFNYPRLAAKRNILKIDTSELNFNLEETQKLLTEIYSIDCSSNDLKLLGSKLEGWITGLHLILQAYGKNFTSVIEKKTEVEENIYLYFAEEIFKSLDEPVKEFLLLTSIVDSFTEDLCKSVPGIENPQKIIGELRKKNLFLESSIDESASGILKYSYSYHNLFKQFLNAKLNELKSQSEIEKLASYIFEYYYNSGDTINAIEFSIYAKNFQKAAELIISSFESLYTNGRYEQLEEWITLIHENILSEYPRLKYYKGLLLKHYKVDLEAASILFSEVAESGKKGSELFILAKSELAEIMLVKGKPVDSVKSLNELLEVCKDIKLRIKVSVSLAKAYYRLGSKHYDDIIKLLDKTIELCDENEIRRYHPEIYSFYGKVFQNRGEFSKSLHYHKNVVQLEKNVFSKFQAVTNIVLLYSWSGEYIKAKEYLYKADEIYRQFHAEAFNRSILRIVALFSFETGDYEKSISSFSDLIELDIKNNIHSYLFLFYLFICESYILLNKKDKANEFLSLAQNSKESNEEFRELLISYHKAIINNLGAPVQSIENAFLSTLKFFTEQDLIYSKTQVEFHLADYYYKTGNYQTALKYLKDSLDTASQKQFNSFLVQNFIVKRYLFDFAIANKLHTDYIQSVYEILAERSLFGWLSGECMQRIKKEIIFLSDITLNTFGGAELYVSGIPVEEEKWIRKKSKLLLIYLLIHREQKHTKDKILELFFGDLSQASAENVFHQSITNIRNVVKPRKIASSEIQPVKGKKVKLEKLPISTAVDSFIQYEDKILGITRGYNYKVDTAELTRLANLVRSPETNENDKEIFAKKAVEIYKGSFLPGYYEDWIEDIRINMQNRFINLCEFLITSLCKKSKFDEVIFYGEKLISEDKLHEEGFISLIDAYSKTGNQNMAKKKFSQLLKNYEDEYGEKPKKEVLDRIKLILLSE